MARSPSRRVLATRQAEAQARQVEAEARARVAEAEARVAEAKAKAEAAARQAELKRAEEAAKRAPYERAYQLGINVAAPAAGIALGHATARSIERRHAAFRTQANKQIADLANQASRIVSRPLPTGAAGQVKAARLAGIVKTADRLNILQAKGPLGLTRAALLVAEGAYVRFGLAPKVENPVAREALNAVGSVSLFAATTQIGERVVQNATLSRLPSAPSMAVIETARMVAASSGANVAPAATSAASRAGMVLRAGLGVAAKIALPLQVGLTALAAARGYRQAGLRGAIIAAGDSLTFGAVSAVARTVDAYRGHQRVASARATLARAAAVRNAVEMRKTATLRAAARAQPRSDGMVDAYTRRQNGRVVRVSGYRRSS